MSTAPRGISEPSDAPEAGAALRLARERCGWTLPDAARRLRIREDYLAALEAGRLRLLPAPAYALGFVHTYARMLGLDPEEALRRFKSEATVRNRPTLAFPVPVPERGLPAGALVLLGVILAGVTYAGWYRLSGEGRLPAEMAAAVPERLVPLTEQAITSPPPGQGRPQDLASVAPVEVAPPPAPMPAQIPYAPTSAAASPVVAIAVPTPLSEPNQPRLVIRASADAWVLVKDRTGPVLLNKLLKAGDTWPVPLQPNLLMTTGNAGGTDILLDGAPTVSLGGSGAVRRDLPLDPDLVKDGKLAPGASPPVRPQQ